MNVNQIKENSLRKYAIVNYVAIIVNNCLIKTKLLDEKRVLRNVEILPRSNTLRVIFGVLKFIVDLLPTRRYLGHASY